MLKQTLKKAQQGFTIIELLIVIAIIGILAGLVLTNFQGAQAKARDVTRETDLNSMKGKLEEAHNNDGYYPPTATTTTLVGIEQDALDDEAGATITSVTAVTSATKPTVPTDIDSASKPTAQYRYLPYNCNVALDQCGSYVIYSWSETAEATPFYFEEASLN